MKKTFALVLAVTFMTGSILCAPAMARTKYDKYGHKIQPKKKVKIQAAAKIDENGQTAQSTEKKEKKVKVKEITDGRGRSLGKAVRDGDSDNFTMYNQRGRKIGGYTQNKDGTSKYTDVRGREIRTNRKTKDVEWE